MQPATKPPLLKWQALFCYSVAVCTFGWFLVMTLAVSQTQPFGVRPTDFFVGIGCFGLTSVPFTLLYGVAPSLPRRGWGWTANVGALYLASVTIFLLPFTIPLLVGFSRDDMKAWYRV